MEDIVSLIAFGTFGNPNGFKQTFFLGDKNLSKQVKTFDLNTNAIKLFPKSVIFMIRKETANGQNLLSYSIYSYAKELNSERSGTFVGSSLIFKNKTANEKNIIDLLNEFQASLLKNNVINDTIQVTHSDNFNVSKPSEFENLKNQLKGIEDLKFNRFSNKFLTVYCPTNTLELSNLLNQSIDLLNVYDCIYFTQSREVAEFVGKKGIFKLIQNVGDKKEFEQEIQILKDERQKVIDSSISSFSREISQLEDDKNMLVNEFLVQIEQNESIQTENEKRIKESKDELEKIKLIYSDFSNKIKDLTNQLKSGRKLEDVKKIYNENKRRFIDGVNKVERPQFVNKIPKHKAKTNLRIDSSIDNRENSNFSGIQDVKKKHNSKGLNKYKLSTYFLFCLLIGILTFQFLTRKDKEPDSIDNSNEITEFQPSFSEEERSINSYNLNPVPNSELNENDYRRVAKKLKLNMILSKVMDEIFDLNKNDINKYYEYQKEDYGKILQEINKENFIEKDSSFYFTGDTLFHIPSYKRE